eukprot:g5319.t1
MCPIDGSRTILYGSCDQGKNVHTGDVTTRRMVQNLAASLNLQSHYVCALGERKTSNGDKEKYEGDDQAKELFTAVDVEIHAIHEGAFAGQVRVILDLARMFPPFPVKRGSPRFINLSRRLRPELVLKSKRPLNADYLSRFQSRADPEFSQHVRDVNDALQFLDKEIRRASNWLDHLSFLGTDVREMDLFLRSFGINMFLLGKLRSEVHQKGAREAVLIEILARTIKQTIRSKLRAQSITSQRNKPSDFRKVILAELSRCFGSAGSSYRCRDLKDEIESRFQGALQDEELDRDYDIVRAGVSVASRWQLLSRIEDMLAIELSKEAKWQCQRLRAEFGFPIDISNLKSLGVASKVLSGFYFRDGKDQLDYILSSLRQDSDRPAFTEAALRINWNGSDSVAYFRRHELVPTPGKSAGITGRFGFTVEDIILRDQFYEPIARAVRSLQRAVRVQPSNVERRLAYAHALLVRGREFWDVDDLLRCHEQIQTAICILGKVEHAHAIHLQEELASITFVMAARLMEKLLNYGSQILPRSPEQTRAIGRIVLIAAVASLGQTERHNVAADMPVLERLRTIKKWHRGVERAALLGVIHPWDVFFFGGFLCMLVWLGGIFFGISEGVSESYSLAAWTMETVAGSIGLFIVLIVCAKLWGRNAVRQSLFGRVCLVCIAAFVTACLILGVVAGWQHDFHQQMAFSSSYIARLSGVLDNIFAIFFPLTSWFATIMIRYVYHRVNESTAVQLRVALDLMQKENKMLKDKLSSQPQERRGRRSSVKIASLAANFQTDTNATQSARGLLQRPEGLQRSRDHAELVQERPHLFPGEGQVEAGGLLVYLHLCQGPRVQGALADHLLLFPGGQVGAGAGVVRHLLFPAGRAGEVQTIWKDLDDAKALEAIDENLLLACFAKKQSKKKLKRGKDDASDGANEGLAAADGDAAKQAPVKVVKLVDSKKQQNAGIVIAKLKMTSEDLRNAVEHMDETRLTQDRTSMLLNIAPTPDEISMLQNFDEIEGVTRLGMVDQFLREMSNLVHFKEHLQCLLVKFSFDEQIAEIKSVIRTCSSAVAEFSSSKAFKKVLEIILGVGNYLNGGTKRGAAFGVKLDVLKKISTLKTTDNKWVLTDFIVKTLLNYYPGGVKDLKNELCNAAEASKYQLTQISADMEALKKSVGIIFAELDWAVQSESDHFDQAMRPFAESAKSRLEKLEADLSDLKKAFGNMASSFGEAAATSDLDVFFQNIKSFLNSFEKAVVKMEKTGGIVGKVKT